MSRKVTIYSTIGESFKEIYTEATTWGALTEAMSSQNINWRGMKAVDGETQHSYESSEALLPEGDFTIFLMADKVKSGYTDSDDDLIDEHEGISWEDESWENDYNNPEEFTFKSRNDLMMARAKKASYYLGRVIDYISGQTIKEKSGHKTTSLVNTMREQAEKLRKNLGKFDH